NRMTDRLQQTIAEITTERKKLEAIVSGMTDAVVATDRHGTLMLLNRAAADLLRADPAGALGRPARETIQGDRLPAMLEDATASGRITAEDLPQLESKRVTLDLRRVNVAALVAHTVDKLQPLAQGSGLLLEQAAPPEVWVTADRDRLEQVLTNLIDNALKYTPTGGRVDVRVAQADREVEISVSDTGKGIGPADLPHVFERFYRADRSRTRGSGGTGLGLAIARHIVEAHGGRTRGDSLLDEGTTFLFTIP